MTPQEISDLQALLGRMRQEDPDDRVFGSHQHHYALGPTLTEMGLRAFEGRHGVRLPDDYRGFLTHAGNGGTHHGSPLFMGDSGAGPYYGLLALEDAAQDCDLSRPFPFTESTEAMPEEEVEARIDPDLFPGVPGALALCHRGSGLVYFLVVNGPAYGTIWEGRENFSPMAKSFDVWYGDWARRLAEHALPRLAAERTVAGVTVGMPLSEVIALGNGEWEIKPWSEGKTHVSFLNLSTQFEVDDDDRVVRIIAHSIYC